MEREFYRRLVAHLNRKKWWHVPPRDVGGYRKRGMFLASSFNESEFWGLPVDEHQKVVLARPLVGNERTIARVLGIPPQKKA
jgi:lambda repressor-like predicted transcriptional regulator